ncbi:UNVERIFIED_CONTAM: hypothetical protein GTU68_019560 [Idotea baltica]|nr:hypothetical protein [Idotea baltica]
MSYALLLFIAILLQACGGSSGGSQGGSYGYGDGPPPRDVDVSNLPDAVPKVELIRKAGNKSPYTVFGKTYQVLPSNKGYRERGVASWYGKKFHGRKTSNGETYDMYAMTAAHKSLAIPSYVKVTNLDNGRTVIVRVNDRGPFHGGRIIDLSYAAAKKLDYSAKGVANVEVVAIDPHTYQGKSSFQKQSVERNPIEHNSSEFNRVEQNTVVARSENQVGAFNSKVAAAKLSDRVQGLSSYPVVVRQHESPQQLFKVLIGPVKNNLKLLDLRNLLRQAENLSSFVVYE